MKIVVIHKEPILDRVPNLRCFIMHAADSGFDVTVLTSCSKNFPLSSFNRSNVNFEIIPERTALVQAPTFIRMAIRYIYLYLYNLLSGCKVRYVFAGKGSLTLAGMLSTLGLRKYVAFVVEYPDALLGKRKSIVDKLERRGIKESIFYITHDDIHAKFINKYLSCEHSYCTLPNATLGSSVKASSYFLHDRLNLPRKMKLLLHSGGFGKWFASKEIADYSSCLPKDFRLVFHVSHNIKEDEYYINYMKTRLQDDRLLFSLEPVQPADLDALVCSAHIGIAWYDIKVLGFRAELMGLASGKIGNFLKCGVPVIVPNFISLSYIRDYDCGVLIDDLSQLADAVRAIDACHARLSSNAKLCYANLWHPTKYLNEITEKILGF